MLSPKNPPPNLTTQPAGGPGPPHWLLMPHVAGLLCSPAWQEMAQFGAQPARPGSLSLELSIVHFIFKWTLGCVALLLSLVVT